MICPIVLFPPYLLGSIRMPASGIFKNAVLGSNSPFSITYNEGERRRKLNIHDLYRSNPPTCSFNEQGSSSTCTSRRVGVKILEDEFSESEALLTPTLVFCRQE